MANGIKVHGNFDYDPGKVLKTFPPPTQPVGAGSELVAIHRPGTEPHGGWAVEIGDRILHDLGNWVESHGLGFIAVDGSFALNTITAIVDNVAVAVKTWLTSNVGLGLPLPAMASAAAAKAAVILANGMMEITADETNNLLFVTFKKSDGTVKTYTITPSAVL